jgi:hypothetical protein
VLKRAVLAGLLVAVVLLLQPAPARAGGSWFEPAQDRYEPGDTATLVGYTGGGALGWVEDGPFHGFLRPAQPPQPDDAPYVAPGAHPDDLALGPVEVVETGRGGWLTLRASITFTLPSTLAPGRYDFLYCNDPCTTGLGDLIGGEVYVGVDPPAPLHRTWPPDEPMWPDGAEKPWVPVPSQPTATTTSSTTTTSTVAARVAESGPAVEAGSDPKGASFGAGWTLTVVVAVLAALALGGAAVRRHRAHDAR